MALPIRRTIVLYLLFVSCPALIVCAQQTAPNSEVPSLEYRVKAAFLLNFTRFIEWPPLESTGVDGPFTMCVAGDDPLVPYLTQTVEGETANGRRLVVQRSKQEIPRSCQVVYVGKSERGAREILSSAGRGILTVGEGDSFIREGGMIAFVIENRHVRFIVNLAAARAASLTVSSKLLSVAKVVEN